MPFPTKGNSNVGKIYGPKPRECYGLREPDPPPALTPADIWNGNAADEALPAVRVGNS